IPGVIAVETNAFETYQLETVRVDRYSSLLKEYDLGGIALIILCDDAGFTADNLNNFVWVTFTRSNPSHDVYGVGSFILHKHWGCTGPIIIDARKKPHHAPELVKDEQVESRVDQLGRQGGSLYGII